MLTPLEAERCVRDLDGSPRKGDPGHDGAAKNQLGDACEGLVGAVLIKKARGVTKSVPLIRVNEQ